MRLWGFVCAGLLWGCSGNSAVVVGGPTEDGSDAETAADAPGADDAHVGMGDPDAAPTQDAASAPDASTTHDAAPIDADVDVIVDSAPDTCPLIECSPTQNCGTIWDGCRSINVECGSCSSPATCAGGGVANHCGTFRDTCSTTIVAGDTCVLDMSNSDSAPFWCPADVIPGNVAPFFCRQISYAGCGGAGIGCTF